jgi:hypothetical protein
VISLIRQAEIRTLPFARLLQQLGPGYGGVVFVVKADAGSPHVHRFVNVW